MLKSATHLWVTAGMERHWPFWTAGDQTPRSNQHTPSSRSDHLTFLRKTPARSKRGNRSQWTLSQSLQHRCYWVCVSYRYGCEWWRFRIIWKYGKVLCFISVQILNTDQRQISVQHSRTRLLPPDHTWCNKTSKRFWMHCWFGQKVLRRYHDTGLLTYSYITVQEFGNIVGLFLKENNTFIQQRCIHLIKSYIMLQKISLTLKNKVSFVNIS